MHCVASLEGRQEIDVSCTRVSKCAKKQMFFIVHHCIYQYLYDLLLFTRKFCSGVDNGCLGKVYVVVIFTARCYA